MGTPELDPHRLARHEAELGQMDLESLLHLWATSIDEDWTNEGLAAVRKILEDRLGYVPERKPIPLREDTQGSGTHHDRDRLVRLSTRLSNLSWVFLVLAALALFPVVEAIASWLDTTWAQPLSVTGWMQIYGAAIVNGLQTALVSLALFLIGRIGPEVVFLLIDVERNTQPK
jgi:hypothetical protein